MSKKLASQSSAKSRSQISTPLAQRSGFNSRTSLRPETPEIHSEEQIENLNEALKETQVKEAFNRQKLFQVKRENEVLKEEVDKLLAYKKKLEKAKELNQKFFAKNEQEMLALRKNAEEAPVSNDYHHLKETLESLKKKAKDLQQKHQEELNSYIQSQPKIQSILQTSDPSIAKLLELLKGQIIIYQEQLSHKEKAYSSMQSRFQREAESLNEQCKAMKKEINDHFQQRKNDMKQIYAQERKLAYLEADIHLDENIYSAKEVAHNAAEQVLDHIQQADTSQTLNSFTSKLKRKLKPTSKTINL
ncbi:unnamed protein product [Blepharisma stoltei]|uniref:Uncharacterized protein n=1 Tax=Blepharisma stoltei TaxID=1481888 RepID=A0AAU9JNN5_9CILI|nr:unnamed protein product [Blepharisma stoltei]